MGISIKNIKGEIMEKDKAIRSIKKHLFLLIMIIKTTKKRQKSIKNKD